MNEILKWYNRETERGVSLLRNTESHVNEAEVSVPPTL